MNTEQAYNQWAAQYDTNINRTRDLEAVVLRQSLKNIPFNSCLEIGCGTGKNTEWLVTKAQQITSADLSQEMLAKAKEKINSDKVNFIQADINEPWTFGHAKYDLVSFSLVLEHISNLDHIFKETAEALRPGGHAYIGELHPFKQYAGSKARFETEEGTQIVPCFNHHITDFTKAAAKHGLPLLTIDEHFDDDDRNQIPRILTLIFKK
jgi:ubiquinone/menaquinone biosynthesis C-methylase UbiE